MGGPDCWPTSSSLNNNTYPKYTTHQDTCPLFIGMSVPSYQEGMPMQDVFEFARDTLHVNYIFWMWRPTGDLNYPTDGAAVIGANPTFNVEEGGGTISGPASAGLLISANGTDGAELNSSVSIVSVQDGSGGSGADGINSAMVFAYKRSASAPGDNPGQVTYTFLTGSYTPANGWSSTSPGRPEPRASFATAADLVQERRSAQTCCGVKSAATCCSTRRSARFAASRTPSSARASSSARTWTSSSSTSRRTARSTPKRRSAALV